MPCPPCPGLPPAPKEISAVICTGGHRALLAATVASLAAQTLDPGRYEILVVLNREDAAQRRRLEETLAQTAGTAVALRVVAEPTLGLSHARNRGIAAACGTHVAFLDDDAQAEPDWLENILACFAQAPDIAAVGGDILPLWEVTPPAWVTPPIYTYFSCKRFGDTPRFLGKGDYFFGTNMAFRRDVLVACGGFPTNLGRKGASLLSNEEWPVFTAIDARGLRKLASPAVRVRHFVPSDRMTNRFLIRRLWWQGISNTVYYLECEHRSMSWVVRRSLADFKRYYGALPRMLRHGQATWRLAFFNLGRWLGIAFALAKHVLEKLTRRGAQPRAVQ